MSAQQSDSVDEPHSAVERDRAEYTVTRLQKDGDTSASRMLANEVPIAVEFDGQPHAVMMATPADLEDFAVGFALSERIVERPADIARIDIRYGLKGIAIDLRLERDQSARLAERRRNVLGQSGCGICGIMTLDEVLPSLTPLARCPAVAKAALFSALEQLPARQVLNRATGAVHAAAYCRADGEILAVREDVGRHNALDKVAGHLARGNIEPGQGFTLMTSRCSYELVQKAVLARIPLLASISAPTELAVAIAREASLTLVALARPDSMLLFNDPYGVFAEASGKRL
jgi:FdhD protein